MAVHKESITVASEAKVHDAADQNRRATGTGPDHLHPLDVLARASQPRSPGALLDPAGDDDGLGRTAMAQRGQDEHHHIRCRPQPVEGRIVGGREGLATGSTAIPLLRLAMHPNNPPSVGQCTWPS